MNALLRVLTILRIFLKKLVEEEEIIHDISDERREIWKDEKIYVVAYFYRYLDDIWRARVIFIYNEMIEKSTSPI